MRFRLGDEYVRVEVSATETETLDETLDEASVVLEANEDPNPIRPMTPFEMEFDDGETAYFVVASDQVEAYSSHPVMYRHRLGLVQNTRTLSKRLLRNTVFTQPPRPTEESYCAIPNYATESGAGPSYVTRPSMLTYNEDPQWWHSSALRIDPLTKIKRAYVKATCFSIDEQGNVNTPSSWLSLLNRQGSKCALQIVKRESDGTERRVGWIKAEYSSLGSEYSEDIEFGREYEEIDCGAWNAFQRERKSVKDIISENGPGEYYARIIGVDEAGYSTATTDDHSAVIGSGWQRGNYDPIPYYSAYGYAVVQLRLVIEPYYYSMYDVLDEIRLQCRKADSKGAKPDLYKMPTGELETLLKGTIAPNMAFTQCTVYDAVAEVFRFFDATFTMAGDGTLGIEYQNDRNGGEAPGRFAGKTMSIGQDRFENGLVSYYQNALLQTKDPAAQGAKMGLRSPGLGVPEDGSLSIITTKPIKTLVRFEMTVSGFRVPIGTTGSSNYVSEPLSLDMTDWVIESSLWTYLNSTNIVPLNGDWSIPVQADTIKYTEGSDRIEFGGRYYNPFNISQTTWKKAMSAAWHKFIGSQGMGFDGNPTARATVAPANPAEYPDIRCSVEYIASVSGRVRTESITDKYDGESIANQYSGSVDLAKMGLNMLGMSLKMGEPSMSVTQEITEWGNRIRKGQIYRADDGSEWIANVCTYTILDGKVVANAQLVKNYNALAQIVRVNREKRLTNISGTLTERAEDDYCEYLYASSLSAEAPENPSIWPLAELKELIAPAFAQAGKQIDYAVAWTSDRNGKPIAERVAVPLARYGAGDAICLEMGFESPISAGNSLQIGTSWFWQTTQYFSKAVKYADDSGFADRFSIGFMQSGGGDFDSSYPQISEERYAADHRAATISNLLFYKRPNEVFALNYELICLPMKGDEATDFIGRSFIGKNGFVGGGSRKLRLFMTKESDPFRYSVLDVRGEGDEIAVESVQISETGGGIRIRVSHDNEDPSYGKTWAICDEDGTIVFASNRASHASNKTVYVMASHERL